jgi:hypothetical protein
LSEHDARQADRSETSLARQVAHPALEVLRRLLDCVPAVRRAVLEARHLGARQRFQGSAGFWEQNYRTTRSSGPGSRGELARYKAAVINAIVGERSVRSVVDHGCGDGYQASMLEVERYIGLDVAPSAVELCRARFAGNPSRTFYRYDPTGDVDPPRADLALSLDVLYHLVEDDVFEAYLRRLFQSATRFVIVYSVDREADPTRPTAPYVRPRAFTPWIRQHHPDWELIEHLSNPHPDSWSDFYLYERRNRTLKRDGAPSSSRPAARAEPRREFEEGGGCPAARERVAEPFSAGRRLDDEQLGARNGVARGCEERVLFDRCRQLVGPAGAAESRVQLAGHREGDQVASGDRRPGGGGHARDPWVADVVQREDGAVDSRMLGQVNVGRHVSKHVRSIDVDEPEGGRRGLRGVGGGRALVDHRERGMMTQVVGLERRTSESRVPAIVLCAVSSCLDLLFERIYDHELLTVPGQVSEQHRALAEVTADLEDVAGDPGDALQVVQDRKEPGVGDAEPPGHPRAVVANVAVDDSKEGGVHTSSVGGPPPRPS